jgi:hypothetical protein
VADYLLSIRTRLRYDGPIFDFRARRAFNDMREELEEEAADWALERVTDIFHADFRMPTGFYESNVRVHNTSSGHEVWDGGLAGPVYGPWLEGVGSRNNTTRFKGYHAFRRAAQALELHIDEIGNRLFRLRYRNRLE